jgi:hypothetical protein
MTKIEIIKIAFYFESDLTTKAWSWFYIHRLNSPWLWLMQTGCTYTINLRFVRSIWFVEFFSKSQAYKPSHAFSRKHFPVWYPVKKGVW